MDTVLHLLKIQIFSFTYKVAKLSVNEKPDSTVIGPAFRG
jgi:hypothetical protein